MRIVSAIVALLFVADLAGQTTEPGPVSEFSRQKFIVFGTGEMVDGQPELLRQVICQSGQQEFLFLCRTKLERVRLTRTLQSMRIPLGKVHAAILPVDTPWIRDYGPISIRSRDREIQFVDFQYFQDRPLDDQVPVGLSQLQGKRMSASALVFQGGNLVHNGDGLALTTSKIYRENSGWGLSRNANGHRGRNKSRESIRQELLQRTRLRQVIVLEPLRGEPNEHVDMFATFVSKTDVVIASVDPRNDPLNAAILDRNAGKVAAEALAKGRKLRVHRLPIVGLQEGTWSTFTNVLFTNESLFVPVLSTDPPEKIQRAIEFYRLRVPARKVIGVNCDHLNVRGGSLHCVTLNIPASSNQPNQLFQSGVDIQRLDRIRMPNQPAVQSSPIPLKPNRAKSNSFREFKRR